MATRPPLMEHVAGFDPARLESWLRDRLPGLAGPMRLERIAGGQSNPTFFVTFGETRLVLRKQPPGELLPSAHAIDREFRVMAALGATAVPIPRMLLFCTEREAIGTPFYVMERLEGRVFHDCALPDVAPEQRREMYRALARALGELHAVDPARVGLLDYGRPGGYFARQIARWTRQWEMSREGTVNPDLRSLAGWLPAHVPPDEATAIVHGDYRVGNVMFRPDGAGIAGILDWELSTLGHPLADLAHCCIAWHSSPDEYGGLRGLDLNRLGIPSQAEFEAIYAEASGHGLRMGAFHMAFALFRFAVIFEGIAARARTGNAADRDAARTGLLSAAFARRAVEVLERG